MKILRHKEILTTRAVYVKKLDGELNADQAVVNTAEKTKRPTTRKKGKQSSR